MRSLTRLASALYWSYELDSARSLPNIVNNRLIKAALKLPFFNNNFLIPFIFLVIGSRCATLFFYLLWGATFPLVPLFPPQYDRMIRRIRRVFGVASEQFLLLYRHTHDLVKFCKSVNELSGFHIVFYRPRHFRNHACLDHFNITLKFGDFGFPVVIYLV